MLMLRGKILLSIMHTILLMIRENIEIFLRRIGIVKGDINFKDLKGKYHGRCFIICTGPSLTVQDLELIRNEISISMNSIGYLYHRTTWRPTFYMIQDERGFSEFKSSFSNSSINVCSERIYQKHCNQCKKYNFRRYFLRYGIHGSRLDNKYITRRFSSNADIFMYDEYTITYSALQMAVFLGFTEIVLIGCDNNLSTSKKKHFEITASEKTLDWSSWDKRMRNSYIVAEQYCKSNGIKIINASREGNLDVFERKTLEEVLYEKGYDNEKR